MLASLPHEIRVPPLVPPSKGGAWGQLFRRSHRAVPWGCRRTTRRRRYREVPLMPGDPVPNAELHFRGGYNDGLTISTRSPDGDAASQAAGHWMMSGGCPVGARFKSMAPAGLANLGEQMIATDSGIKLREGAHVQ